MIRCSHCGKLAPTGALSCQNCGMPLESGGTGVVGAGQTGQQELPAWLESLRAHERPVPSGQENRQPFTMDELVDENSMPSWMRQDRQKTPEVGNSDAFPVLSTPAQPGTNAEKQNFPPGNGLEAGSLIDERALPSWMRDNQGPGQSVSANSLVDQKALPAWIKDLSQSEQPQAQAGSHYGLPVQSMENHYGLPLQTSMTPPSVPNAPRMPQTPPPGSLDKSSQPTQGFSAHDLVDQRAMPGWMTGAQGPGQQPQSKPVPTERGFSAGDLVDQRSVPSWMKDLQGQGKTDPVSAMGVPVDGSGQMTGVGQGISGGEGMPASTLLDLGSMPTWMRQGEQGNASGTQQAGGGMAAGSLIDLGSMPEWLRNSDNPQPGAGARPGQVPARPEGMRVPSRPRNEIAPQGQSEVAANVFASMLGVAASAPALPGQDFAQVNNLGVAQGQPVSPFQQAQPSIPGWQSPVQQPAAGQGAQPQMWQVSGPVPAFGASPTPNAYVPGEQPGVAGGMQPRAYGMEQPVYPGFSPADRVAPGSAVGVGNNRRDGGQTTDTKKKGFFDSIREFFFK